MSVLVNERFLGHKHFIEFFSPEGHKVEMGINSTYAFHALDGVNYITFDGSTTTFGDTTIDGTLDVSGDTTIGGTLDVTGNTSLDGDLTVGGNFSMTDTQWTDLKFPFTRDSQGQNSKPDFDFTELGLLFPQNDEAEEVYIIGQFGHDRAHGTDISPHLHYIQDTADIPIFEMTYRWIRNGDAIDTWTTIETSATTAFPYTSGSILQLLEFPMLDGSGIDSVSSMMDIIIRRQTGDGLTGDVLVKEFDIHYQVDSVGSDSEYVK